MPTPNDARACLKNWRETAQPKRLSFAAAGRLLGCDKSLVRRIELAERNPGRALANTIERVVGIPSTLWDESPTLTNVAPDAPAE